MLQADRDAEAADRRLGFESVGKRVVTAEGDVVGRVARVREGVVYVTPRPGLFNGYGPRLVSSWPTGESFELDEQQILAVDDERVVLEGLE